MRLIYSDAYVSMPFLHRGDALCCAHLNLTLWPHGLYSSPGTSVHGISQARLLEWIPISYSRGSSQPTHQTLVSCVSCIGRQILYHSTSWEVQGWYEELNTALPTMRFNQVEYIPYFGSMH